MKKLWVVFIVLTFLSCTKQIINQDTTFLDNHTFEEVWEASVRAVKDIDFTIDSMDKDTGFISAESGRRVFESRPPRLSIMITDMDSKVSVDCRVCRKNLSTWRSRKKDSPEFYNRPEYESQQVVLEIPSLICRSKLSIQGKIKLNAKKGTVSNLRQCPLKSK